MSEIDLAERPATAQVRTQGQVQVRPAQAGKAKNFRFPVRRAQRPQSAAEIEANRLLIEDFIAKKGVTVCPKGYASGAVPSQYEFV